VRRETMSTDSIPPPFDPPELAAALVELRDSAHALAGRPTQLWIESADSDDCITAD
jgi:hypothetical protein